MTTASLDGMDSKLHFLREELDSRISEFERRRRRNKKLAFWLSMSAAAFAIAVTILLGVQTESKPVSTALRNVALVASGVVSFLNAWDAFFNHKERWVRYKSTSNSLKALRSKLHFLARGKLSDAEIDEMFAEYQMILQQTNTAWQRLHAHDKSDGAVPKNQPKTN